MLKKLGLGCVGLVGLMIVLVIVAAITSPGRSTDKTGDATTPQTKQAATGAVWTPVVSQPTVAPPPTLASSPTAVPSKWNDKELDANKNGNVLVAINLLTSMAPEQLQKLGEEIPPADVKKAPWNYYGKIVKLMGTVGIAQDFPPASDLSKALGGQASELILVNKDSTIIDYILMGSSGKINVGSTATVYGYPVGIVQVPNKMGGQTDQLLVVGKLVEGD